MIGKMYRLSWIYLDRISRCTKIKFSLNGLPNLDHLHRRNPRGLNIFNLLVGKYLVDRLMRMIKIWDPNELVSGQSISNF